MPRAFTVEEKNHIKEKLIKAASDSIVQLGIKKTSIDDLVKSVAISKGGFYLFYPSKEALLFDVIKTTQKRIREDLTTLLQQCGNTPELVVGFLRFLFDSFNKYPVMRVISNPDEMVNLMRSVPLEQQMIEQKDDDAFFISIFEEWKAKKLIADIDSKILAGIPRIVMAMVLQKEMLGTDRFEDLVELITNGLAKELVNIK